MHVKLIHTYFSVHTESCVLGQWKHYSMSKDTLQQRTPHHPPTTIHARELDRYLAGADTASFRQYNYNTVPYLGESDGWK